MENTLKKRKPLESNFELQITALIDTLVIILIFLLKSIATDTLEFDQGKGITVPMVVNGMTGAVGNRLDISSDSVSWNGQKILELENFDLKNVKNGDAAWKTLNAAISQTVAQEKLENKFEGKLFFQADKKTPFLALQEILKVAKSHGYKDIRFVGAKYN